MNIKIMDYCVSGISVSDISDLIIYGAAEKGNRISAMLDSSIGQNYEVCDSDEKKWGTYINYIHRVQSPEQIYKKYVKKLKIFVFICTDYTEEVLDVLNNFFECNPGDMFVLSYWGVMQWLYLNRYKLFDGQKEILFQFGMEDIRERNQINNDRIINLNSFIDNLKDNIIWIFGPGKAGSESLWESIKKNGLPCIHTHYLNYPKHIFVEEGYQELWEAVIEQIKRKKIKIITSIREPIIRDFSAFWQPSSHRIDRQRLLSSFNGNAATMYKNYTDAIVMGKDKLQELMGNLLFPNWVDEFDWFDEQIRDVFGFDIYKEVFDTEKGYYTGTYNNIDFFVYKVEKFNDPYMFKEIERFIGIDSLERISANESKTKKYRFAYNELLKKIRLSRAYFEHYYLNNHKMDFFYSKEEKINFMEKWEPYIDS